MRLPTHLLLFALLAASQSRATTIVLPVIGPGLLPPVADELESGLRAALVARGVTLQTHDATHAVLGDATAGGLTCNLDDVSCAARIGAIADADHVIFASMAPGKDLVMTLADVDVATQSTTAFAVAPVQPPTRDAGRSLAALLDRVTQPQALLDVHVAPAGALVVVDGVGVGPAPLRGPVALSTGDHTIRADLAGHESHTETATLAAGAHDSVTIALLPKAVAAPHVDNSGTFYLGVGTAAVGGVLGLSCAIGATVVELELEKGQKGDDTSLRTTGLALVGGAALGAVAVAVGGTLMALNLPE